MTAEPVATLIIRIDISLERPTPTAEGKASTLTVVPEPPASDVEDGGALQASDDPAVSVPAAAVTGGDVKLGGTQREVLAWLADHHGTIADPAGSCTTVIADDIDRAGNHVSGVVKVLTTRGFVTRDTRGKRTYRISITDAGRDAVGRLAPWVRTNQARDESRTATPSRSRPVVPVMPEPGRITRAPFDPEAVRDSAANAL